MARPRAFVPPVMANFFDERSSGPIGLSPRVMLGSGRPLIRVFCFLGASESLTVKFSDAFTKCFPSMRGAPGAVPVAYGWCHRVQLKRTLPRLVVRPVE